MKIINYDLYKKLSHDIHLPIIISINNGIGDCWAEISDISDRIMRNINILDQELLY